MQTVELVRNASKRFQSGERLTECARDSFFTVGVAIAAAQNQVISK